MGDVTGVGVGRGVAVGCRVGVGDGLGVSVGGGGGTKTSTTWHAGLARTNNMTTKRKVFFLILGDSKDNFSRFLEVLGATLKVLGASSVMKRMEHES